jgi:hypothetical protein
MLLIVEGAGIDQILDFAIALDPEGPPFVEFPLQAPVHLELQAVDLDVIPDLSDEKRVDGDRVAALHEFREWTEQDFIG